MGDQVQTTNIQKDVQRSDGPARASINELVERSRETARALAEQTKVGIRQPTTLAAVTGGAVVAAAMVFGLAPTALGALAAWVTYHNLQRQQTEKKSEEREIPAGASRARTDVRSTGV